MLNPFVYFGTDLISSHGLESMQYGNLVNYDNWLPCVMIHRKSYPICITYTSALTMGNPSRWLRQAIPLIRRRCTTISIGLPKSMNQRWINYLLTRSPWLVYSMQFLMHPNHVQCKRHELNAQINVNTPKG